MYTLGKSWESFGKMLYFPRNFYFFLKWKFVHSEKKKIVNNTKFSKSFSKMFPWFFSSEVYSNNSIRKKVNFNHICPEFRPYSLKYKSPQSSKKCVEIKKKCFYKLLYIFLWCYKFAIHLHKQCVKLHCSPVAQWKMTS